MTGLQHHQGWWERMHVSASKLLWNKREVDGYRVALDTTFSTKMAAVNGYAY